MYAFYLDGVRLPVAPSKMTTKIKNQNKTINLINDGEVNILKEAGLTEVSFDVLLPQVKYPFTIYVDGFKPATYFTDKFKKLKDSKQAFQFLVNVFSPTGKLLFDINMTVSMEDYTVTYDAQNGLDLVVSINLKEFRLYGTTKKYEVRLEDGRQVVAAANTRTSTKEIPKSYTVKKGDTLWAICKKQLGDGSKYHEIAKLNGIKNPNLIKPGQVIKFG
ncbi:LysM peptidoglycan-binding domain-containing protein [Schinkia azotoformans]|uniref:LysM peptidoglycan-binding domain-containing protein n=1 Tax=Schinkia azotoformans TaxID=1454 RepID=UPI002DB9495F|nr:LysM peptidoglycan-binding domain-containing protein [Schinkia azotoformans]MEC1716600.1 LysM peptidoglycan-binding domain-containing protein [Schinkia azotoformans]MEC1739438.1 LysM peptidoglycan-binding domain-containing protein [Schinkia azotoformans]MEC1745492.1 LysM peptidoglycan-binding domain-containing protein [Schinkia azotoformans]MEC1756555.1 LysM peptidoglycan-binding domain-containing protein [Schinkia azotoformans]MEC1765822.1 LysM peptidoglycan-binding domain-containing prote